MADKFQDKEYNMDIEDEDLLPDDVYDDSVETDFDEYNMDSEDFDDDDFEDEDFEDTPDDNRAVEVTLNNIAEFYFQLVEKENVDFKTLRHTYFDIALSEKAKERGLNHEELLLYASIEEDSRYLDLMSEMYKVPKDSLYNFCQPDKRDTLLELLVEVSMPLFKFVDSKSKGEVEGDIRKHVPLESVEEDVLNEEDMGVDPMEVDNVVNTIMSIYEKIYAPCFINRPMGVLTAEGVVAFKPDGSWGIINNGKSFMVKFYHAMNSVLNGYLGSEFEKTTIGSHCFNKEGKLIKTYMPIYHLYNINGIKSDGTKVDNWVEFAEYLKKDVRQKVVNVLSKISAEETIDVQRDLIDLFTNCIIIETFDVTKQLSLTYKLGVNAQLYLDGLFRTRLTEIFAKPFGKQISHSLDDFQVGRFFFVFDMSAYTSEILFSYKSYENMIRSGNKPSISRVVVGKNLDGTDYIVNLNDNTLKLLGIQGDSRSGKGVLTLNIIATLYAEGNPVMYLDFKPDMAATMWDMERYFNSLGFNARIFSVDGLAGERGNSRPPRYYPYGKGVPDGTPFSKSQFSVVPYLKSIQLFCVITALRARGKEGYGTSKKFFIVMDEMQGLSRTLTPFFYMIRKYVKDLKTERGKNGEPSFNEEYFEKFLRVFDAEIGAELKNVRDVTGGTGNAGMIMIAQKVKPEEWRFTVEENGATKDLSHSHSFAFMLLANTNLKFIGKNAGVGTSYGIEKLKIPGAGLVDDRDVRGYWVATSSAKPTDSTSVVFKSYLTLNENDFNEEAYRAKDWKRMPYTGGVLRGLDESAQRRVITEDLLDENGNIRDSIGFAGLMRLIAGGDNATLAKNMSAGYELVEKAFHDLGLSNRYSCVEEYLFDCSYDSIYSFNELLEMFDNGGSRHSFDDLMDGDRPKVVSPSWVTEGSKVSSDNSSIDEDTFNEGSVDVEGHGVRETGTPIVSEELTGSEAVIDDWDSQFDDMSETNSVNSSIRGQYKTPNHGINQADNPFSGLDEGYHEDSSDLSNHQEPINVNQQSNTHEQYGHSSTPLNDQVHYENVYDRPIVIQDNPFKNSRAKSTLSTVYGLKLISKQIVDEMKHMFGTLDRIEIFEATSTGLVVNGYAFRPTFDQEFIETLPFDIQQQVKRGNLTPLFDFDNLYRFKYLDTLIIDTTRLAEGRVKRELGLPNKLAWYKLLQRKKYLKRIIIQGQEIVDRETCEMYENSGKKGYDLEETLSEKLKVRPFSETPLGRLWRTTPAKIATGALGATLGVKAIAVGVSIFGGWGLLFGAFAGYGAYRKYVKKD